MDRNIVYAGSIPLETDILTLNKNAMLGLGYLAQDIMGANNVFFGLPCTPTSPASLAVQVGAGRAYSLQNVDNSAYSSLAADTTHQVLKQGILLDPVTLATAAPATAGFSINYLIQASFQEVDSALITLPYYNAANPSVAFSGPGGSGTPQATLRQGAIVISAKPGIAATSGTQTTPSPDAGYTGLYVVTVANGATTVTSGNIAVASAAPFASGSYTTSLTGCTTTPTGIVKWRLNGQVVTALLPGLTGTSNTNACSLTGLPSNLWPTTQHVAALGNVQNGSTNYAGAAAEIGTSGIITLQVGSSSFSFVNSGTKGLPESQVISWMLGF